MTQEKIVRGQRSQRPQRTPVGQKGRLTVSNKDPNKVYRIVNDKDSRVELFQQNGWEVETNAAVGIRRADVDSGIGATINVGLGDRAVLMSIPKEWYEEDQKAKQEVVDGTEQTIRNNALSGHKGEFKLSRS